MVFKGPSALGLLDLARPYAMDTFGSGAAYGFQVGYWRLGLSPDAVRRAMPRLVGSPLYELTMRHLRDLPAAADLLESGPAASMLGSATTELVRALIASVAFEGRARADIRSETLLTRVRAYVDQNLRDPDLTPASIAAAHHISLRTLYNLLAGHDETPARLILARRLDGARRDLGRATADGAPIGQVANRWGFRDLTHFSRRFREAFSMTPTEWVQLNREARSHAAGHGHVAP